MNRRELIRLVGGALTTEAIPANAQELRVRTVGVLIGLANDAESKARVKVLKERAGRSAKTFASSTATPKAILCVCRLLRRSWWN
jgi:hypothetical protein